MPKFSHHKMMALGYERWLCQESRIQQNGIPHRKHSEYPTLIGREFMEDQYEDDQQESSFSKIQRLLGGLGSSAGWATAFSSGHDPGVPESNPTSGSLLTRESASPLDLFPLVLSLSNK